MKDIILQIISTSIQTLLLYSCFITVANKFCKEELNKKEKIISLIVFIFTCTIVTILHTIYTDLALSNSVFFIFCIFLLSKFLLKTSINNCILLSFSPILIMAISEIISVFSIRLIFNKTAEDLVNSIFLQYVIVSLDCVITALILFILNKFLMKKININKNTFKDALKFTLILLICIIPQLILFGVYKFNYPISILIVNTIQIILVCIIIFNYLNTIMKKEKAESDLEISELHNKTMIGMVDGVRTLKHDYNNIMQALNGYVSTKQYDKLQEHINKVLDECNIVNNLSVIDQKVFNDPAIYGIVGAKYFIAMEADIKFELDIVTNIKEISFPMPELSRILGIILDNAIEATSKTDNKYMKLEMKYDARKDADIIKVYNTYDTNIDINLKDIYKKGVSSKKIKSGIGLWEVKKLIDKSKNSQIYASLEHGMFVQNIIIEKVISQA